MRKQRLTTSGMGRNLASSIGSQRIAMIRPTFVCGLMAVAAVATASAEDFPLTFKDHPGQGRDVFPWRPGNIGALG